MWKRLKGATLARVNRWFSSPITVGALISFALTVAAFIVVIFSPIMAQPGQSWRSLSSWKSGIFGVAWLPLCAAAYLKASERIRKNKSAKEIGSTGWVRRQLLTGNVVTAILDGSCLNNTHVLKNTREEALQAIALNVCGRFEMGEGYGIVVNLLTICPDMKTVEVVARSENTLPLSSYDMADLAAWQSVKDARVYTVDDIMDDPRWRGQSRRYRSVFSMPVTKNKRAYGILTIDSKKAYAFFGKNTDIALLVEPYVRLLAATFPDGAPSHDCLYLASQHATRPS